MNHSNLNPANLKINVSILFFLHFFIISNCYFLLVDGKQKDISTLSSPGAVSRSLRWSEKESSWQHFQYSCFLQIQSQGRREPHQTIHPWSCSPFPALSGSVETTLSTNKILLDWSEDFSRNYFEYISMEESNRRYDPLCLKFPIVSDSLLKRSSYIMTCQAWNQLPYSIKIIAKHGEFKSALQNPLISSYTDICSKDKRRACLNTYQY